MADESTVLFPQIDTKKPAEGAEGNLFSPTTPVPPKPQYAPETITGKVKATAAGVPEGLAYRAGIFGDVQSGMQSAQPGFVDWALQKLAKTGLITPQQATEGASKARAGFEAYNKKLEEAGLPKTDFPTSEQLINLTPEALKYQPKNPAEERYKSGSSMATQIIGGGGGKGVYQKVIKPAFEGFGAGYLAKGAEQVAEGHPAERWIAPVAAIVGQAGSAKLLDSIKNLPTGTQAQAMIAQSLAKDIREGKIKLTQDQLAQLSSSNVPLSIADIVSPDSKTAKMLREEAGILSELPDAAAARNREILSPDMPRLEESRGRTKDLFQRVGGPLVLEPAELQDQINLVRRAENDAAYRAALTSPVADNIYAGSLGDIVTRPKVIDAMVEAYDGPSGIIHERDPSIFKLPGRDPVTGAESAGNLAYWNKVKQVLGEKYESLVDPITGRVLPGRESEHRMLKNTMDDLKNKLIEKTSFYDPATGSVRSLYDEALDKASEGFGAASAPEAGRKFYKSGNMMRTDQLETLYNSYNDGQKALFKNGYLSDLYADLGRNRNGYSNVADKIASNANGYDDKMRTILGNDYDAFRNHITAESVYNRAQEIVGVPGKFSRITGAVTSAPGAGLSSAAGAYYLLQDIMFGEQFFDPSMESVAGAVAAGVGASAISSFKKGRARSIANKVLNLVSSGKPEDMKKLIAMSEKEPLVPRMLQHLNVGLRAYQQQQMETEGAVPTNQSELPREGRATGGKVRGDVMAKVAKLMAMADSMHKKNTQETEKILNVDDNTVAKALAVANKGI